MKDNITEIIDLQNHIMKLHGFDSIVDFSEAYLKLKNERDKQTFDNKDEWVRLKNKITSNIIKHTLINLQDCRHVSVLEIAVKCRRQFGLSTMMRNLYNNFINSHECWVFTPNLGLSKSFIEQYRKEFSESQEPMVCSINQSNYIVRGKRSEYPIILMIDDYDYINKDLVDNLIQEYKNYNNRSNSDRTPLIVIKFTTYDINQDSYDATIFRKS
jgi:hypothetical protein